MCKSVRQCRALYREFPRNPSLSTDRQWKLESFFIISLPLSFISKSYSYKSSGTVDFTGFLLLSDRYYYSEITSNLIVMHPLIRKLCSIFILQLHFLLFGSLLNLLQKINSLIYGLILLFIQGDISHAVNLRPRSSMVSIISEARVIPAFDRLVVG